MSLEAIQHEFENKTVAVVGYGVFGRSAVNFIQECAPKKLIVLDDKPDTHVPDGIELRTGEQAFADLETFDVVVRSPGFPPERLSSATRVVTDTSLLLKYFKPNVVGVTGTKGKSTTVRLLAALLEAAGQKVIVAGNIGRSYFDIFEQIHEGTMVVAELSSYQLSDVVASPHWALLLPIASDHLTWHGSQDAYEQSKAHIFQYQTQDDHLVYWGEGIAQQLIEKKTPSSHHVSYPAESECKRTDTAIVFKDNTVHKREHEIVKLSDLQLKGEHNFYNIIGSLSIAIEILREKDVEIDASLFAAWGKALCAFEPLKHHLEAVADVKGVRFIDDSYASTPIATEAALKTVTGPKVLIFGGQSRGLDLHALVAQFDVTGVEAVILIGADEQYRDQIKILTEQGSESRVVSLGNVPMNQIVGTAFEQAATNSSVVLSPGHPSFDMFDNFVDRGEQFQRAVQSLADEDS